MKFYRIKKYKLLVKCSHDGCFRTDTLSAVFWCFVKNKKTVKKIWFITVVGHWMCHVKRAVTSLCFWSLSNLPQNLIKCLTESSLCARINPTLWSSFQKLIFCLTHADSTTGGSDVHHRVVTLRSWRSVRWQQASKLAVPRSWGFVLRSSTWNVPCHHCVSMIIITVAWSLLLLLDDKMYTHERLV